MMALSFHLRKKKTKKTLQLVIFRERKTGFLQRAREREFEIEVSKNN
jgi:hypothetical protein